MIAMMIFVGFMMGLMIMWFEMIVWCCIQKWKPMYQLKNIFFKDFGMDDFGSCEFEFAGFGSG